MFGKVPLAGVLKIGLMIALLAVLSMIIGIPVAGRLIKRVDKTGIDIDPPMDNAKATASLSNRMIDLEESQKAALEIQEETQKTLAEIQDKLENNGQ
ncbi:MAG: hypothetical protein M3198_15425 [Actinomycetota bacterium]|nr:hypothetical protein [Actinomycetota bacterium]